MDELILESHQYRLLLRGTWLTVQILGGAFVLGLVLSVLVGVGRLSHRRWVRAVSLVYVEFFRGISSIVLLFIFAIAIPILLGVSQDSLMRLAMIALGANMGGYGAEIIRGSIQAIPKGQSEASIALNLSNTQRLRHVVLPQALRIILPPFGNLTIEILKGTALVSLVGLTDIMQSAQNIRTQQLFAGTAGDRRLLFLNVLMIYFVLAQIINLMFRLAERAVERRFTGGPAEILDDPTLDQPDEIGAAK